jgi:hypothetical protein
MRGITQRLNGYVRRTLVALEDACAGWGILEGGIEPLVACVCVCVCVWGSDLETHGWIPRHLGSLQLHLSQHRSTRRTLQKATL